MRYYILFLFCLISCKSSKHIEYTADIRSDTVQVNKTSDSIINVISDKIINSVVNQFNTNTTTEKIYYSEPDEKGKQHILYTERSNSSTAIISEQQSTNTLLNIYKRNNTTSDSLNSSFKKKEKNIQDTKKTSGSVFSWSGIETAAVLAILLLIIIFWVIAKIKGYI